MISRLLRRPATWVMAAAVTAIAAFGLYWFQPWKLVTDRTVADSVPVVAAPPPPIAAPGTPTATPGPASAPTSTAGPGVPTATGGAPAGNRLLANGTFITHEHPTKGTAQVVQLPDGRRQLVLRDLATSNGPDLRVWLTDRKVEPGAWDVFDDGRYVEVSRLRGNRGNQVYDLPTDLDLADYRSVSIWCLRFSVSFGAAELTPA